MFNFKISITLAKVNLYVLNLLHKKLKNTISKCFKFKQILKVITTNLFIKFNFFKFLLKYRVNFDHRNLTYTLAKLGIKLLVWASNKLPLSHFVLLFCLKAARSYK